MPPAPTASSGEYFAFDPVWKDRRPFSASHQHATIRALGIHPCFDVILVSEPEGVRKPDVLIFQRAPDQLGLLPAEAVFVGDHPEADIEGARNTRMWSIWKRDLYWG